MLQIICLILIILQEIQIIYINVKISNIEAVLRRMTYENLMKVKVLVEENYKKDPK